MAKANRLADLLEDKTSPAMAAVSDSTGRVGQAGPAKRGPRPAELKDEPPARANRKAITVHYPEEVQHTLKKLAADEKTTIQALVGEGIDLLMRSRSLTPFNAR